MAEQHDLDLANQIGAAFRADLNLALRAISAKQWGDTAPPTLLPYLEWADTTTPSAPAIKIYDGASWLVMGIIDATNHLWQPVIGGGTNTIASAGTTNLASIAASGISVTGTTTITSFGTVPKGQIKRLTFVASLTLTYNATSLILPGARNIQTRAGDTCLIESLGAGNWQVVAYQPAGALPNAGLVTEATVASAATTNLGAAASQIISVTGTTTITSFGSSANTDAPLYFVRFAGALTLTHNGTSLILPGAANITTVAGDSCIAQYLGSGNWKVLSYSGTTTGAVNASSLNGGQLAGFRNAIINGNMLVAQRRPVGAAATLPTAVGYSCLDRWAARSTSATPATIEQSLNVPTGARYSLRIGRSNGSSTATVLELLHALTTNNSVRFQGKQVTLSFYAFRGANFSNASNQIGITVFSGTGTDEATASMGAWTGVTSPLVTTQAITAAWVRYSYTFTVPSGCTQLGLYISSTPTGTSGADDNLYLALVQLEEGTIATPFEHRNFETELAMCMAYYEKSFPYAVAPAQNANAYGFFAPCSAAAGIAQRVWANFRVRKRKDAGTVTLYNPNAANAQARNGNLGTDFSSTTAVAASELGLGITGTAPASTIAGTHSFAVDWAVDCEL